MSDKFCRFDRFWCQIDGSLWLERNIDSGTVAANTDRFARKAAFEGHSLGNRPAINGLDDVARADTGPISQIALRDGVDLPSAAIPFGVDANKAQDHRQWNVRVSDGLKDLAAITKGFLDRAAVGGRRISSLFILRCLFDSE